MRSLRSSRRAPTLDGSRTTFRLKCRMTDEAEVETEFFDSGLDSEESCFNGDRYGPRGRIYSESEEEVQEKELLLDL